MGKLSKILLTSLFASSATAENFQVTRCNDETTPVSNKLYLIKSTDQKGRLRTPADEENFNVLDSLINILLTSATFACFDFPDR